MTAKEYLETERSKLKQLTFRKKLEYIWDYYKPLMAGILAVIIVIAVIVQIAINSQITTELSVGLFNSMDYKKEIDTLSEDFAAHAGLDGKKQEVIFDSSYQMDLDANDSMTVGIQSKVIAVVSAGTMDVMLMPEDIYEHYLDAGMYMDLKQVLSAEEYKKYQSLFIMDKNGEDTEEKAYGLCLERSKKLSDIFPYDKVVLCVAVNTKNENNTQKFVQYLLSEF